MANILSIHVGPSSRHERLWDVCSCCLAFLLPWACVTSYTLHFFYLGGAATLLDSGWFVSLFTHGEGLDLPNPPIIRPGSYYAIHMAPLIALIRLLHQALWNGFDAVWFSAIQGVWYGMIGCAVWLATRRAAPALALPAAMLTGLGGVELATLGLPHFEVAMPAIILFFLVLFGPARNPWALLLLPLLLAVREDAGLHAGCLLALIGTHFALRRTQPSWQAARIYLLVAGFLLASAFISIAVQHRFFPDGNDALHRIYLGRPALSHVNLHFIALRLKNLARQRLYISVPLAVSVLAAIRMRDRLLFLGPLACVPWLMLAIIAVAEQAGTLQNYYAFPFIVALAWPAMCLTFRTTNDSRLVRLQIAMSAVSVCLLPFCTRNVDPDPWAHALPPAWSTIRRTEAVLDSVLAARASLGNWVADDAAASLRLDAFDESQVAVGFYHTPLQVRQTDVLFGALSLPVWLAERQAPMIQASRLNNIYAACGTMLILRTRAPITNMKVLENFRLVATPSAALSNRPPGVADKSC